MDMDWLIRVLTWAAIAGAVTTSTLGVRMARLRGWFEGRAALLASMTEAQQRGLTGDEWMALEVERDRAKLPKRWRREVDAAMARRDDE